MTIEIDNSYPSLPVPGYREIIETVIRQALAFEECPYEAQVYVLMTDNQEIRSVNASQRQIDRETDVLSFPMAEYPEPGVFDDAALREAHAFHPDSKELILGDIILSMDRVISQAADYGHSRERELAFLVAHSMLHLMGYDHMEEDQAALMEARQEEILSLCGYTRQ